MTCKTILTGDGTIVIACSRRRASQKRCSVPGCDRSSEALCDYPLAGGRTCDKPLCHTHRGSASGAPDLDHCPAHRRLAGQEQRP